MHHSLISTALLALQQQGELKYQSKVGKVIPSGFYKAVQYNDKNPLERFQITICMNSKSPTGYSVRVEAIGQMPEILLLDRHLESFEEFEDVIDEDFTTAAYKAMRRRQLGK